MKHGHTFALVLAFALLVASPLLPNRALIEYLDFRSPATGRLTHPAPDLGLIRSKLKWDIEQAGRELDAWQQDQTFVDTALLLCEHVGSGVFGRGENSYYCVRGGEVLFERAVGKELFWWRMQDVWIPRPPAPLKSKSRASEPWVGYQP